MKVPLTLVCCALLGPVALSMGGCCTIRAETEPSGAQVYLNGHLLGTTPFSGVFWAGQNVGAVVEVVWPGHDRSEVRPYPGQGGDLTMFLSAPSSAQMYVDGLLVGATPCAVGLFFPNSIKGVLPKAVGETEPAGTVSCDLRLVRVSDGAAIGEASGRGKLEELEYLAKALARKLREDAMIKDESVAVVTLRNRDGTPQGRAAADELADKVAGALIATRWFEVKERIDLRSILEEKDLEASDIVKNPKVAEKLAGVKLIVIGGVTLSSGK